MVLNRWYEHDKVQFQTKLSQKNSFIEKNTGWDKLRSRFTKHSLGVSHNCSPTSTSVAAPPASWTPWGMSHNQCYHFCSQSSSSKGHITHWFGGWGALLLNALEIGEGNFYFIYCLTRCFDFQIVLKFCCSRSSDKPMVYYQTVHELEQKSACECNRL